MSILNKKEAWNICFIICHQHQTRCGMIKAKKTENFGQNTTFFCKN